MASKFSAVFLTMAGVTASAYLGMNKLFKLCMCRGNKLCFASLVNLEKEQRETVEAMKKEYNSIKNWQNKTKQEIWHIKKGTDRLYAKAFINVSSQRWVVIAHGYGGDGSLMLYAAKRFYDKGYSVLLPDLRAHGKSSGKYVGWGLKDKDDIEKWCQCITKTNANAQIILYGVSMGAAAVLMAAGDNNTKGISCVVSDCAYTSLKDILYYRIRRMLHLPPRLVMYWLTPLCQKKMNLCIENASVLNQVKKCRVPVMFCHGDRDRFVPTDNALELYSVAKAPKKLMLVHGAGHGVSAFIGGEKYWSGVFDFTEKFIN